MRVSRRLAAGIAASALLVLPAVVHAVIPKADRIARAAAKANKAASRSQALQIDLTLRVAGREPIGSGKLVTHPTGLARLELRDAADRRERHLLLGTEHSASRNGEELEEPRAFLPPLFLLQVSSPTTLRQALADFGLDLQAAGLAPCGTALCYVLGDPARVVPPPADPAGSVDAAGAEADRAGAEQKKEPRRDGFFFETMSEPDPPPTVWIDSQSFEILRIESRSGVAVDFGPRADFGEIRFPGHIVIHEPQRDPVRFDIQGVTAVNAPAAGFSRDWLLAPPPTEPSRAPMGSATP